MDAVHADTVDATVQLKAIKERLAKLDAEKAELQEYYDLDRQRRAIEYCILDSDRQATLTTIHAARALST